VLEEPLGNVEARQLARRILEDGFYVFTRHCENRLMERDLSSVDCMNVIRGGHVTAIELVRSAWRYRFETPRISVVVEFESEDEFAVITAWRK